MEDQNDIPIPDLLDRTELPLEEKIVFSEHMEKVLREAIHAEIAKLPIGKIVASVLEKEIAAQEQKATAHIDKNVEKVRGDFNGEVEKIKTYMEGFKNKMRNDHDAFKSLFGRDAKPWYQFGGYSGGASSPTTIEGITLTNAEGELLWKIVVVGENLQIQTLDEGVWTEKASFLKDL